MSRIIRQMDQLFVVSVFLCWLQLCSGQATDSAPLEPTVLNTTGIDKYYVSFPKGRVTCAGLDTNGREVKIPILKPQYCKPSTIWPVAPCCDQSTNFRCKQDIIACPTNFWGPFPYKCQIIKNDFYKPPSYAVCRCNSCLYAGPNHNCCPLVIGKCAPTNYQLYTVLAVCVNVLNPIDGVCKIFQWYLPTACSCLGPGIPFPIDNTGNNPTGTS